MSLINKESLLKKAKELGFGDDVLAMVEEQEEVICECDIAENAATICSVMESDMRGEAWKC